MNDLFKMKRRIAETYRQTWLPPPVNCFAQTKLKTDLNKRLLSWICGYLGSWSMIIWLFQLFFVLSFNDVGWLKVKVTTNRRDRRRLLWSIRLFHNRFWFRIVLSRWGEQNQILTIDTLRHIDCCENSAADWSRDSASWCRAKRADLYSLRPSFKQGTQRKQEIRSLLTGSCSWSHLWVGGHRVFLAVLLEGPVITSMIRFRRCPRHSWIAWPLKGIKEGLTSFNEAGYSRAKLMRI